ncbi:hypothetical protein MtrunA17_Chr1g0166161 [Medicago truncatula]|uniref:Uncharacterized protein n=1 Tax=Medicago truncatula TaxID=3880 RepID=A0A396JJR0_MEDTR|nr:hypothetical protein MtrunA17_Chr1g0166161 [Medicago truncatula]
MSLCSLLTWLEILDRSSVFPRNTTARDLPISQMTCSTFLATYRHFTSKNGYGLSTKLLAFSTSDSRDSRATLALVTHSTLEAGIHLGPVQYQGVLKGQ